MLISVDRSVTDRVRPRAHGLLQGRVRGGHGPSELKEYQLRIWTKRCADRTFDQPASRKLAVDLETATEMGAAKDTFFLSHDRREFSRNNKSRENSCFSRLEIHLPLFDGFERINQHQISIKDCPESTLIK
jgi:hypothetical protein